MNINVASLLQYSPTFHFTSTRVNVTLELGDSYAYRREICTRLYESAKKWLRISMDRAPLEINGLLQDYLSEFDRFVPGQPIDAVHVGRSLALEIGKAASRNQLSVGMWFFVFSIVKQRYSCRLQNLFPRYHVCFLMNHPILSTGLLLVAFTLVKSVVSSISTDSMINQVCVFCVRLLISQ